MKIAKAILTIGITAALVSGIWWFATSDIELLQKDYVTLPGPRITNDGLLSENVDVVPEVRTATGPPSSTFASPLAINATDVFMPTGGSFETWVTGGDYLKPRAPQILTGTGVVADSVDVVYVDPASIQTNIQLTLPTVADQTPIEFYFGGQITEGNPVTYNLTFVGTVLGGSLLQQVSSGDSFKLRYRASNTSWYISL